MAAKIESGDQRVGDLPFGLPDRVREVGEDGQDSEAGLFSGVAGRLLDWLRQDAAGRLDCD